MKTMNSFFPLLFCFCVVALLVVGGCTGGVRDGAAQSEVDDTLLEKVISTIKEVEVDLGLLEDEHVFDYQLDGIGEKEIGRIFRSCGCVGPALSEGDKWNFDQHPFKITVSLAGKAAGKGVQDFLISFTDDTAVRVKVTYVYLPLPSGTPENMIFKNEETEKVITLSFPGEKDINVESIELPSYMSHTQKAVSDNSLDVIFVLDRNNLNGERDGVIRIRTTSERKALFTVPFLVLSH